MISLRQKENNTQNKEKTQIDVPVNSQSKVVDPSRTETGSLLNK